MNLERGGRDPELAGHAERQTRCETRLQIRLRPFPFKESGGDHVRQAKLAGRYPHLGIERRRHAGAAAEGGSAVAACNIAKRPLATVPEQPRLARKAARRQFGRKPSHFGKNRRLRGAERELPVKAETLRPRMSLAAVVDAGAMRLEGGGRIEAFGGVSRGLDPERSRLTVRLGGGKPDEREDARRTRRRHGEVAGQGPVWRGGALARDVQFTGIA